jgi:hypothetical protein
MEDVVKYSIARFITLRKERGLNDELIIEWLVSNWASVIKMNTAEEVIDAYKAAKGFSSMITDSSIIGNLPTLNEYKGIFFQENIKFFDSIKVNVDPFNIYYAENSVSVSMKIKLSNKQGYSGKEEILQRNKAEISMGASDMGQLDQYFRKGLIYVLTKKYDYLIRREGVNNPSIDTLVAARDIYLGLLTSTGNNSEIVKTLEKIRESIPLAMGKVLKALRKYHPDVVAEFEGLFGAGEIKALEKGASIINRFGF